MICEQTTIPKIKIYIFIFNRDKLHPPVTQSVATTRIIIIDSRRSCLGSFDRFH